MQRLHHGLHHALFCFGYHAMIMECLSARRAMSHGLIIDDYLWMVNLGFHSRF